MSAGGSGTTTGNGNVSTGLAVSPQSPRRRSRSPPRPRRVVESRLDPPGNRLRLPEPQPRGVAVAKQLAPVVLHELDQVLGVQADDVGRNTGLALRPPRGGTGGAGPGRSVTVENGIPVLSVRPHTRRAASPWPNSARKNPTTFTPDVSAPAAASVLRWRAGSQGACARSGRSLRQCQSVRRVKKRRSVTAWWWWVTTASGTYQRSQPAWRAR